MALPVPQSIAVVASGPTKHVSPNCEVGGDDDDRASVRVCEISVTRPFVFTVKV